MLFKFHYCILILSILLYASQAYSQCENVALGKPATASSSWNAQTADKAFDGNCSTVWNAGNGPVQWIQVDLLNQYTVNNINMMAETSPDGTKTYNIYTSPDMSAWTLLESFSMYTTNGMLIDRAYTNLTNVRGVKVETASGVSWVAWKEIGVFTVSSVSLSPSGTVPVCEGDTLNISASQGLSYIWNTGDSTQNIAVTLPGTYTVTVGMSCITDSNCINTDSVTVYISTPVPNASVISDVSCYNGNDGVASTSPTDGYPPYAYTWSNGSTDSTATGLTAGTYFLTITDSLGCTSYDTVIINQPQAIWTSLTVSDDYGACEGSATATASGGTAPYTYQWDVNAGNQTTQTADSLCAGNYCVTVTDNNGCTKDTCVDVPVGISTNKLATHITIYPNPNKGSFTLLYTGINSKDVPFEKIEIYDLFGRKVLETHCRFIDMNTYPKGVYLWKARGYRGKIFIE